MNTLRCCLSGVFIAMLATALHAQTPAPLTVCMSEDNPPFSQARKGQLGGFDVTIAQDLARELGRELRLLPFETELEKESMLTHEVNALLSAGLCDLASGFPLLKSDLGAPSRARFKTPDHPGAKRARDRPFVPLGTLIASQPYQGTALVLVQRAASAPVLSLLELKGQKVGAVAGTLEGTIVAMYRGGALTASMVSLGQTDDVWAALQSGRIDALLAPSAAYDAHRQRDPASTLRAGPARPLGINLGWVALAGQADLIAVLNRLIERRQASGELVRWASEAGLQWQAPTQPAVTGSLSLAGFLND